MDSLVNDSHYFAQIAGSLSHGLDRRPGSPLASVRDTVSSLLGTTFPLQWERVGILEHETNLYAVLSELFPMSSQNAFFWEKLAKPFASMLETTAFPLEVQCRFLTFVYARVIGMMGPQKNAKQGSIMTFDGSPVELSWIIPRAASGQKCVDRQIRFAIEPIDPRTGELLCGNDVLDYLVSTTGSLGLVDCGDDGMNWRRTLEKFLFPGETSSKQIPTGSRFFVGFDFAPTGRITLKAYYLPSPRAAFGARNTNSQLEPIRLWDSDWTRLRSLMPQLHPSLAAQLEKLISFIDILDEPLKPRIQILAVDCVSNSANRLKIYCRPREGASWADACRMLTLGGKFSSTSMSGALANLEILWNNLFPSSRSTSGRPLEISTGANQRQKSRLPKRNEEHPTGGLLYYFSLHAGVDTPLPKIYLPVSRYCRNDLQICNAVEQAYKFEQRRTNSGSIKPDGWVAGEVSKAFGHRNLKMHTGIHTYITLAIKDKGWETTSYFSPEVWS